MDVAMGCECAYNCRCLCGIPLTVIFVIDVSRLGMLLCWVDNCEFSNGVTSSVYRLFFVSLLRQQYVADGHKF